MEKISIKVGNNKYPFYKTMRGVLEFSESGYTNEQMISGSARAILQFIFCYIKGACSREEIVFPYDFESFVDNVDENAMEQIAATMQQAKGNAEPEGEAKKK